MTNEEKIAKFEEIQKHLWDGALNGNLMQSTLFAALIRQLNIPPPEAEDSESA